MSTLDQIEIRKRVAKTLKIVASGQSVTARDGETIDDALADVLASLSKKHVANYLPGQIPQYAALPIVALVAGASAKGCHVPNWQDHVNAAVSAIPELRRLEGVRDRASRDDPELYI